MRSLGFESFDDTFGPCRVALEPDPSPFNAFVLHPDVLGDGQPLAAPSIEGPARGLPTVGAAVEHGDRSARVRLISAAA